MSSPRKKSSNPFGMVALWGVVVLFVVVVGGFLAFRIWFNAYLEGPEFREMIGGITSKSLKAKGEYLPFHFAGTAIYSDAFKAEGTSETAFTQLGADQIRAEINLKGLWDRTWQIDGIDIQRMQASLGHANGGGAAPAAEPGGAAATQPAAPSFLSAWLPNHVDLRKITVHETNLKWAENTPRSGTLNGTLMTFVPEGKAWNITCEGGTLSQSGEPEFLLDHAELRYQQPTLFITGSELHYGNHGSVQLSGEINFGSDFSVLSKINGIPVTPFLREDWRAKLKGDLFGDVKVKGTLPMGNNPSLEGSLRLDQGELEALPVLDQIATFTKTERFRRLSLNRSSADFKCENGKTTVTNFIAESGGLIRVEGGCVVEHAVIDGTFQVGVTPVSLQWLPGSQSKVFTISHDGYLWTTMHITGPVDHPQEDLSQRLVAAAAGAVIDTIQGTIQQLPGGDQLPDAPKKLINDFLSPLLK